MTEAGVISIADGAGDGGARYPPGRCQVDQAPAGQRGRPAEAAHPVVPDRGELRHVRDSGARKHGPIVRAGVALHHEVGPVGGLHIDPLALGNTSKLTHCYRWQSTARAGAGALQMQPAATFHVLAERRYSSCRSADIAASRRGAGGAPRRGRGRGGASRALCLGRSGNALMRPTSRGGAPVP
eukprot:158742-Pyramimonas_sp.AAC.1